MIARKATRGDFPALIRMSVKFHELLDMRDLPLDPDSLWRWLEHLEHQHVLAVVEDDERNVVGALGGMLAPVFFNDVLLIGQELFWWVDPEHRAGGAGVALLDEAERQAREAGCVRWNMLNLAHVQPEAMARLYRKQGYNQIETTWSKVL